MATATQIIADIDAYMRARPWAKNSDWYVGIAADARARLFNDHAVNEKTGSWIYRQADSNAIARQVEKAYHDSGHDGGPGGGDRSTVYVYAYVKTSSTKE
jgi:hypothetical protein